MLCSQSNKSPTCTSECYRYIMECHFNATLSNASPRGDGNVKPCTGSIHNYLWVRKPRSFFLLYGVASSLKHLQQNTSTCFMKVYLIIRVFTNKHACEVVLHFPTWSFMNFLVNVFDIARFKRLRKIEIFKLIVEIYSPILNHLHLTDIIWFLAFVWIRSLNTIKSF